MKIFRRILALGLVLAICLPFCQLVARADNDLMQYDHAWCFQASDKSGPKGAPVGEESSFTYEYGKNGSFSLMTKYHTDWSAWTLNGNAPAVGEWYLSSSKEADGAVV